MIIQSFEDLAEYFRDSDLSGRKVGDLSFVNSNRKRVDLLFPISSSSSTGRQCLRIRAEGKVKTVVEQVLFECLFGNPRVFQWFVLFELLYTTKKYSIEAQAAYDVLIGLAKSSSKNLGSPLSQIMSNMQPVRKTCGLIKARELAETFRENRIMVPESRDWPSNFLTVTSFRQTFRKTAEVRRIGVGYKDKGNLPLPGSEYEPDSPLLFVPGSFDLWEKFRRNSTIK
jgi:hypothetical protein